MQKRNSEYTTSLLYKKKKKITIQLNNQTELTYQFKYQSFKYERGKAEI